VRGIGRLVTPGALHAVDLGAGGRTNNFSRIGWARHVTMTKVGGTDGNSAPAGTTVTPDPAVCLTLTHHGVSSPLGNEPVTFTVMTGGGTVVGLSSVTVNTDLETGCAHAPWVLGTTPGPNTLTAAAFASGSPLTYTATGTGSVAGKPLYVANLGGPNIEVYAAGASGNATPTATIPVPGNPFGIALDGAGNIYVTNISIDAIIIYAAGASGNATPPDTIGGPGNTAGVRIPRGIALDGAGNIYVANEGNSTITVYAAGASGRATPMVTIAGGNTGLSSPSGIARDGAGNIYVINHAASFSGGSITVYAAGATGNATPVATIAGDNTGLSFPVGIALDGAGNIYVANFSNSTITVYAAGASGNATPMATITGPGLNGPFGIALDGAGNIYVTNFSGNSITVYPAGASGNATPTATIVGGNTGLSQPALITF